MESGLDLRDMDMDKEVALFKATVSLSGKEIFALDHFVAYLFHTIFKSLTILSETAHLAKMPIFFLNVISKWI